MGSGVEKAHKIWAPTYPSEMLILSPDAEPLVSLQGSVLAAEAIPAVEAALKRAKLICSRLGLDVSKELDLTPELIKGRVAMLTVDIEPYEDAEGRTKQRNVVSFAGYERASESDTPPAAGTGEDDGEEHLPF